MQYVHTEAARQQYNENKVRFLLSKSAALGVGYEALRFSQYSMALSKQSSANL
jgi:hypothetical protein